MNAKLAAEIVRMADEDQLTRRKMQTMHDELISVDARNTQRLREIVAEIGWPTRAPRLPRRQDPLGGGQATALRDAAPHERSRA